MGTTVAFVSVDESFGVFVYIPESSCASAVPAPHNSAVSSHSHPNQVRCAWHSLRTERTY